MIREAKKPPKWSPTAHELTVNGWECKVRNGKRIWKRPSNPFYYSEEMALHLSREERGK